MRVEKRYNQTYFPWLLDSDNEWTLLAFANGLESAQQLVADQYKITAAYEYRIIDA